MLSSSYAGPTRVEAPSCGFSLPPRTLFNFINWLLSHSLADVVVEWSERGWAWVVVSAPFHHPLLPCFQLEHNLAVPCLVSFSLSGLRLGARG